MEVDREQREQIKQRNEASRVQNGGRHGTKRAMESEN
jgi:hypothetical protein